MRWVVIAALGVCALSAGARAQGADTLSPQTAWTGHNVVIDEVHADAHAATLGSDGLVIRWDLPEHSATRWTRIEGAQALAQRGTGWTVFTLEERVELDDELREVRREPNSAWIRCAGTGSAWSWSEDDGRLTLDHPTGAVHARTRHEATDADTPDSPDAGGERRDVVPRAALPAEAMPSEVGACSVRRDGAAYAWPTLDGSRMVSVRGTTWSMAESTERDPVATWSAAGPDASSAWAIEARSDRACAWDPSEASACIDRTGLGLLPRALAADVGWTDGERWIAGADGGWLAVGESGALWFRLPRVDAILVARAPQESASTRGDAPPGDALETPAFGPQGPFAAARVSVVGCDARGPVVRDAFEGTLLARLDGDCPDRWWAAEGRAFGFRGEQSARERVDASATSLGVQSVAADLVGESPALGPLATRVRARRRFGPACGDAIIEVEVARGLVHRVVRGACDEHDVSLAAGPTGDVIGVSFGDRVVDLDGVARTPSLPHACDVSTWPVGRSIALDQCASVHAADAHAGLAESGAWVSDGDTHWASDELAALWIVRWREAFVPARALVDTAAWESARRTLGRLR